MWLSAHHKRQWCVQYVLSRLPWWLNTHSFYSAARKEQGAIWDAHTKRLSLVQYSWSRAWWPQWRLHIVHILFRKVKLTACQWWNQAATKKLLCACSSSPKTQFCALDRRELTSLINVFCSVSFVLGIYFCFSLLSLCQHQKQNLSLCSR